MDDDDLIDDEWSIATNEVLDYPKAEPHMTNWTPTENTADVAFLQVQLCVYTCVYTHAVGRVQIVGCVRMCIHLCSSVGSVLVLSLAAVLLCSVMWQ
eukprot:Lankesteria_metandrocarpae@DN3957_c0_g1_i1.p3